MEKNDIKRKEESLNTEEKQDSAVPIGAKKCQAKKNLECGLTKAKIRIKALLGM